MELKDLVGKTVKSVVDSWEGDNEGDTVEIFFSDGTSAKLGYFFVYSSEPSLLVDINPPAEE